MLRRSLFRLNAVAASNVYDDAGVKVSRLANGMRVMSFDDNSGITGLSFLTLAGPRFETADNLGISMVMENLPLKGTAKWPQPELSRSLGALGNAFKFQNHKECLAWSLMAPRYHVKEALSMLNGIACHPTIDEAAFDYSKQQAMMMSDFFSRDATRCCFEYIHQAAWQGKGLGIPLIQPPEVLEKLSLQTLHDFHNQLVRPERSVLVGSGVSNHEEFLAQVAEYFPFQDSRFPAPVFEDVPYTGGELFVHNKAAPKTVKKFEEHNHTHIGMCFKGVPMTHKDYEAYAVIQTLLGGGTSFSSGGPGKGLQTKLFREVINRQGWVHGIECVTAWYTTCGLVGLYGQVEHKWARHMVDVMAQQLATIAERIDDYHWEMAKNQLLSQLVLLVENRELLLEECGKNLLLGNHVLRSQSLIEATSKLSLGDLKRVCGDMVKEPMVYAVYGDTESVPPYDVLVQHVNGIYQKCRTA